MDNQFSDKCVLVTGGTAGLGLCMAEQFVQEGARVFICGRDKDRGHKVARQISADYIPTDVCDREQTKNLFAYIRGRHGQLDIAINNVGLALSSAFLELSEDDWSLCLDANLTSMWRCMQWEIRLMLEQIYGGVIVNMSSIAGFSAVRSELSPYVSSKHAVLGLTKAAALEFSRHNIRINALCPGLITSSPEDTDAYPVGRTGTPLEVARVAMFLASDQASYITGQAIPVDGGFSVR